MAGPSSIPSDYDEFLFAIIGEETNGMPLSVLSALTRLDLDPWQQAARLTRLSRGQAIREVSSLIGALPRGRWRAPESESIATRLVTLLPSRNNRVVSTAADKIGRRVLLALLGMWLIFAAVWGTVVVENSTPVSNTRHAQMRAADALPARHPASSQPN